MTTTKFTRKYNDEVVEIAKELYLNGNKTVPEIIEELHNKGFDVKEPSIRDWITRKGWSKEKNHLKLRVEGELFDERLNRLVARKQKALESYNTAQTRALNALEKKDDLGDYELKFRDASSATTALDTAIRGEFFLSEETIPLRVIEFLSGLFIESLDEMMIEDKAFTPEIANKLAHKFSERVRAFGHFWISGGKTAKNVFT